MYTVVRSLDTALGVVVGVVINYLIAPPNHLGELVARMEKFKQLTIDALEDEELLTELRNDFATLSTFYKNFTVDKKYNRHIVSHSDLAITMEGIQDLYFHAKSLHYFSDDVHTELTKYHTEKINDTLKMTEKTIIDLKKSLKRRQQS